MDLRGFRAGKTHPQERVPRENKISAGLAPIMAWAAEIARMKSLICCVTLASLACLAQLDEHEIVRCYAEKRTCLASAADGRPSQSGPMTSPITVWSMMASSDDGGKMPIREATRGLDGQTNVESSNPPRRHASCSSIDRPSGIRIPHPATAHPLANQALPRVLYRQGQSFNTGHFGPNLC
jgi:hypothetical protein